MSGRQLRLGIDVGDTSTDAVVMSGHQVVASAKRLTTSDVREGVVNAIAAVLGTAGIGAHEIGTAMIGTTQFINAFVQRRHLSQVAVVRVSLPKADGIPPMATWPQDLLDVVGNRSYLVGGGSFFDGKEYSPLDTEQLRATAQDIRMHDIRSIAITSNFAPARPDIEHKAAKIILSIFPDADITPK